jgi:hypothetical protein
MCESWKKRSVPLKLPFVAEHRGLFPEITHFLRTVEEGAFALARTLATEDLVHFGLTPFFLFGYG